MKKNILITLLAALLLSSCGEYNKLLKSTDYEYKYEAAKNYFAKGQYNRAATLLNELPFSKVLIRRRNPSICWA